MPKNACAPDWMGPPERRYRDVVSPPADQEEEELRTAFLTEGLAALDPRDPARLVLPPPIGPLAEIPRRRRKDLHLHNYVDVGIVLKGEMGIWWEGKVARCPSHSVLVTTPGLRYQPHIALSKEAPASHTVVWLALHRSCAFVHRCSLEGSRHLLSEYHCFTDPQVTLLARSIAQELGDRSLHYETAIRGSLMCLFARLGRAPAYPVSRVSTADAERNSANEDAFSARVEAYLLSHYHRPLTLQDIARAVGCSRAHLCRRFHEATGQTPFQCLKALRMEAAKRLLRSEVPIGRVAEMVGFDDPLYFSRVFSSHIGESPRTYRSRFHPPAS
ncbi:MAG TPA: AraC family transcriptional regulator [Chthonomonadaceae bacterium]|nr:AraC family transcriptional regulator [Chthonomonadaceae bacterium]